MEKSVSRWKLHRQMTNTSSSVLKIEENLWRSGKWYLNYLIFGAKFNGLVLIDIVYCLLFIVFVDIVY